MKKILITLLVVSFCTYACAYDLTWDFNQPYQADAWTAGLWHFDEAPGGTTAYDETANNNDAVISGDPADPYGPLDPDKTWAPAKFGNGLKCWYNSTSDLNNGTLIVDQDSAGNNSLDYNYADAFTIEFWMNATNVGTLSNPDIIFTKGTMSEGQITYTDDGAGLYRIGWTVNASGWQTMYDNTHIPLNEWHHVAIISVYDSVALQTTLSIYIDGFLSTQHTYGRMSTLSGTDLTLLGPAGGLFYRTYSGQLDELRISTCNRLTLEEELFRGPDLLWDIQNPYEPDDYTLALWHFDETNSDAAYDATLWGNDAVITGDPAGYGLDPVESWTAGKFGNALTTWYNSSTDANLGNMVITQDDTNSSLKRFGGDITIEAWIKPSATSSNNNPDYIYYPQLANGTLALVDDNKMSFTWYNQDTVNWPGSLWNTVYDITPIPVGSWTHIALTVANSDTQGEYTFYVNGKSSTRHYYAKLSCANAGNHYLLGSDTAYSPRLFQGQIDEMRISSINRMNPSGISESKWYQPHDGTDTYSVSLYHFDEVTGTTAYDSRGSNDGMLNGHTFNTYSSTDVVHPAFDRSLEFDGNSGQTVVVMDDPSLDLTDKFTIEAWIKPTAFGDGMINIVYKVDDSGNNWSPYSMGLWGSGLWCQFTTANGAVTKSITVQEMISPNIWQHVAMTFDKGKAVPGGGRPYIKIYINGQEIAPEQYASIYVPNTLGPNLSDGPVLIGMWDYGVTPYEGWIDEVRISNIAMDFNPVGADVEIIDLDKAGDDLDITFTSALYGIYTVTSGTDLDDMANWPVVGGVTGDIMNTTYSLVDAFLTANQKQFYRVEGFTPVEQGYPTVADKAITVDADLSDWAAGDLVADRNNFFPVRDRRALPYEDIEVYVAYSAADSAFYIGWETKDVSDTEEFEIMFNVPGTDKNVRVSVDAHDAVNDLLFHSTTGGIGWDPDLKTNTGGDTYTEADLVTDGGAFAQTTSAGVWSGEIKLPYSVIDASYTFGAGDQRTVWFNRNRGIGTERGTTNPDGRFWEWVHATLYPAGVGVQR